MAIVDLKSDLAQIQRNFGSNTKTAGITQAAKRTGVNQGLSDVILPRTNIRDINGNIQINYDEKNKFQVPIDRNISKLEVHWDSAKDSYYAKGGKTNDTLGIRNDKFGSTQPYVIKSIGDKWGPEGGFFSGDSGLIRGGAGTVVGRVLGDLERTSKFMISGKGLGFTAKQFGLQLLNVGGDLGERANIYNPLSPLLNTVPLLHFKRHVDIPVASDFIRKSLVGNLPDNPGFGSDERNARYKKTTGASALLNLIGIGGKPKLGDIVNTEQVRAIGQQGQRVQEARESKKARLGFKIKGRLANNITSGDELNLIPYGSYADTELSPNSDFIPFRFKDVNNNKYLIFRAILSGITDNFTPEFAGERYVGRPDQVYVYQGTNREISFTFDVYPKTRQELPVLWEKLNFLTGLVYPSWAPSSGGLGMVAPFIELTIGDMYKDTPGFLSQLSLTVQDGTTWEIDDYKLPKYIQVNCSFTYIGKYLPNQIGKHYELPWLEDSNTEIGTFYDSNNEETTPELAVGKEYPYRAGGTGRLFGELGQAQ